MSAPKPDHILQTGMGFFASKAVLSAVEMEVFTELAKGPETFEKLTGHLGLHPKLPAASTTQGPNAWRG